MLPMTLLPSTSAVTCSSDKEFCSIDNDEWMVRIRFSFLRCGEAILADKNLISKTFSSILDNRTVDLSVKWKGGL